MDVEFKGDFFKDLKKINRKQFLRQMTTEAGTIAVNFSKERFRYKNWLDKTREPWSKRKRKDRGSLMAKSGRLKRSIRKISQGNYYVLIGTDVPYAQIHNEGGTINETANVKAHNRKITIRARKIDRATGRARKLKKVIGSKISKIQAHKRQMNTRMPKRQFLGESVFLVKKIERHMLRSITKTINNNQ